MTLFLTKIEMLGVSQLLKSDWESIKQVSDWLKAFQLASTEMSTTKKPMLSKTLAVFRGLQEEIRKIIVDLPHSADQSLRHGLIDAHTKLSDYYYKLNESVYYTWAACASSLPTLRLEYSNVIDFLVLDPRIYYESLAKDFKTEPDLLADIQKSKAAMEEHFKSHYPTLDADSNSPAATSTPIPKTVDGSIRVTFLNRK